MLLLKSLIAAASLTVMTAGVTSAETYRLANPLPESDGTSEILRWFAAEIAKETNDEIQFDVSTGAALVPPKASLQATGDGVIQVSFHTSSYTPSELPVANALAGYSFIEGEPAVIAAAWADFAMHEPVQRDEFFNRNVVPMGGFSTPLTPIICNTSAPITELSQFKGLKVRSLGLTGALVQNLGGVAVNISANEIYQALQTGQVDCAAIFAAWLNIDNKLEEVSKHVTMMDFGGSFNSPMQLYNRDFWTGLTVEQRATVLKVAARAMAKLQLRYYINNDKALALAQEYGLTIDKPGQSIADAMNQWVRDGVGDMAGVAKNTYRIQDPETLLASFQPYVDKWRGLIAGMSDLNNEDELTQVLYDNLFGTLDPASYGVK